MIILTKEHETGVAVIDKQHKELVNRLNAVTQLGMASITREETEKTLRFLEEYVIEHFADEEKLQVKCAYPKYEWHKSQHQFFISEIQKLKEEFLTNGPSAMYTLTLNNSIIQWIVRHIKTADVELGKYYLAHR